MGITLHRRALILIRKVQQCQNIEYCLRASWMMALSTFFIFSFLSTALALPTFVSRTICLRWCHEAGP
ncbi:hypothetical protein ABVK25_000301 [Lepraria finkii]|uniref:Uncharacterized protein n=1 Tax=Lepraria finkii TaxID=1340010 RepID=A0ABR4BMJ4_9LECA